MFTAHVTNMIAKIGEWVKQHRRDLWVGFCTLLVSWSAYNLGLIRARSGAVPLQEARVFQERASEAPTPSLTPQPPRGPAHTDLRVVVSKTSSSKKYHFSWCSSANRIKEQNKLWFATEQAAQAAGYTLAANCKK
jgi:hypothetical protein